MNIEKDFEELYEGWKKGKYKITDDKGNIIGKYSSGSKAQKVVDDLMQQGKYDKLTVEIIEETELGEAYWRVDIPDMPPVFIEAGSASEIKKDMRKKLKPESFKELSVERVTKSEMIKKYREMVKGGGEEEEEPKTEAVEKEASTYRDKQKKSKDKKQFGISRKKSNVRHGGSGYGEEIDENKIVIGGKELDREWTGWWWRKNEKWTVVDGKNNMLASAKSSGEAEKWMKKLKDASQTRGDFSLAIGNPKLMLNHGQFGMPGLDFDKIFKSVNKDPDQLTIRKIDKKDHDRYFERAKKVNKKYDYTNLELTYDGGRKHYAPKKVKEEIGEAYKDLPPHLQKLVKKIEKKQKDWNKQNPNAKIKTLVYNPDTGKPDIEVKENMDLKDTIKKVIEDNTNDKSDDGEGLDKVQPKAVKKKFKDRKDKDIDNDGDVDSSDKFLHKKRKAISKAMSKEQKSFSKMFSHIKSLMQGK